MIKAKGNIYRVIRSGSWFEDARACRSAHRVRFVPDRYYDDLGFRLTRRV